MVGDGSNALRSVDRHQICPRFEHHSARIESIATEIHRRNAHGDIACVSVYPDTPVPIFDEYFVCVNGSGFPPIANEELLD